MRTRSPLAPALTPRGVLHQELSVPIPLPGSALRKGPPVWTTDRTKGRRGRKLPRGQAHLSSADKQRWLGLETGPQQNPHPPLSVAAAAATLLFKSNVAWKSLLQQLPLKPIVSSAPLTRQLLAAADGANTPWRAATQFKITSPAQTAGSRPISRFHQIEERVSGHSLIMLLPKLKTKL